MAQTTLFIDADACPVTREALDCARAARVPCVIAGNSTPAIAEKLFISQNTVKSHRYHIFRKMTVESKQEIINIRDQYIERYKNL